MHTQQTVDFVRRKVPGRLLGGSALPERQSARKGIGARPSGALLTSPFLAQHTQFMNFSYKKMTVMEAVDMLHELVDESDPDVDFPNSFHAFQTAESIRKAHPDKGVPRPTPPRP